MHERAGFSEQACIYRSWRRSALTPVKPIEFRLQPSVPMSGSGRDSMEHLGLLENGKSSENKALNRPRPAGRKPLPTRFARNFRHFFLHDHL
jgi:hypothetical protein